VAAAVLINDEMMFEDVHGMSMTDVTLVIFAAFTCLGLLAYGREVAKAIKDQSRLKTISPVTWALLLAANASAVAYALERGDWMMASLLFANVLACGTILMIAGCKQS
jgi:hypothetical protein